MSTRYIHAISPVAISALLMATFSINASAAPVQAGDTVVVTVDNAPVLPGPSKVYYKVSSLSKGTKVKVIEAFADGYIKVAPPADYTCFVRADKVKIEGQVATLIADRVDCLAAGVDTAPEKCFRMVRLCRTGETLDVVAVEGDYVRVKVPEGVFAYVSTEYCESETQAAPKPDPKPDPKPEVKPEPKPEPESGDKPDAEPEPEVQPEDKPSDSGNEQSDDGEATAPEVEKPVDDGLDSPAEDPALRAALKRYQDARDRGPLSSEVAGELRAAFEGVAKRDDLNAVDRQLANAHVRILTREEGVAKNRERVEELTRKTRKSSEEREIPKEEISYDVVGKLVPSTVYDGKKLPRLYCLTDPKSGRTLAYVLPSSVEGLDSYLYRLVGMIGPVEIDPTYNLSMIRVQRVDAVKDGTVKATPEKTQPEYKPEAEPEDKPEDKPDTKPEDEQDAESEEEPEAEPVKEAEEDKEEADGESADKTDSEEKPEDKFEA